jgi:hypothetical protein
MRDFWSRLLGVALALLMLVSVAAADTLELKDGRIIQGTYMGGTQRTIRFKVDNEVKLFPVADVLAVTFTDASAASEAPAQPAAGAPALAPTPTPAATTAAQTTTRAATPTAKATGSVTVPAGTKLLIRMIDGVDSDTNKVGDSFRASLEEDLVVDEILVAAKGSDVTGRLVQAKEAGRLAGRSELKLELTELYVQGQPLLINTGEYAVAGEGRGGDTAKKVGIGAAVGAVVGAIAGGGKGAAIGAGVGAGAGTAVQVFTKGEQVKVPSETMLEFELQQPLTVRLSRAK